MGEGPDHANGNQLTHLTDASYYGGKLHAYWGPLPTLVPLIANDFLHLQVTEVAQVLVAVLLALYLLFWVAWFVIRRAVPNWSSFRCYSLTMLVVASVGLSHFFFHVASFGYIWFESIAYAQLFSLAAWLVLVRPADPLRQGPLLGAGILMAAAVPCKQSYLLHSVALAGYWLVTRKGHARALVKFAAPLVVVGVLLAWWNWLRFDTPLETGLTYQNSIEPVHWVYPSVLRWPANAFNTFFNPFHLTTELPFLEPDIARFPRLLCQEYSGVSLFLAVPFLTGLCFLPFLWTFVWARKGKLATVDWMCIVLAVGMVAFWPASFGIVGTFLRYLYDWAPYAAISTALGYLRLDELVGRRHLVTRILVGACCLLLPWQLFVTFDQTVSDTQVCRFFYCAVQQRATDAQRVNALNRALEPIVRPFVDPDPVYAIVRWELTRREETTVLDVKGPLTVHVAQSSLAVQACLAGLGLAYLAESAVAAHVEAGRLVRVLEDWTPPFPGFCLYYPHQRGSAGLRAFIEVLRSATFR